MSPVETLIRRFHEAGGELAFRPPDRLVIRATDVVLDKFRARLKGAKLAILELLRPPDPARLITEAVPDATVTATHSCKIGRAHV